MDTSLRHGQCYIAGRCFAVSHSKAKLCLIASRRRHKAAARGPEKGFRYIVCTRAADNRAMAHIVVLRPVTRVCLRSGLIFDDKDPRDGYDARNRATRQDRATQHQRTLERETR
jgi:hypothetical protein